MVNGIEPNKTVTLSFPQVSHSCLTNMKQGYFIGKSARCICRATFDGYPKGSGQWYKEDQTVGTIGDLGVTYHESSSCNMRRGWESNPRPPDHKSDALTTEPRCSTPHL
ncbi:hypothetical protein ElyMa_006743600 [Elysia marginata]|uniref:Ig-like domain-containing protein n=1 Tax=Elysia marginata TaxID=1093978 RepID=A0AAV4J026_9GAST|nr:hypothetical protein ElyMa_006743600 [Elysia marginata]